MSDTGSRGDLLDQSGYAEAITRRIDGSVSRTWISKATRNGKTVAGRFRPDLDAVFDDDQLVGYREPTDRSSRSQNPGGGTQSGPKNGSRNPVSGERSFSGAAGTSGVRENPNAGNTARQVGQSGQTGRLTGFDKMARELGVAVNNSPAFRKGVVRLGAAAGGFLLVSLVSGESDNLGTAAVGAAVGLGIAEYSIQSEAPASPTKKLPPGMSSGRR